MKQRISITRLDIADVPALYAMMTTLAAYEGTAAMVQTNEATLARDGFGEQERFSAFLAKVNDAPVGYVSYTVNYSIWAGGCFLHVDDVYVAEPYRNTGVGRLLMQSVAKECAANHFAFARWTVETDNARAIKFYQKLGATVREKGLCIWRPEQMSGFLDA